mgnify:CR=1 FL=1
MKKALNIAAGISLFLFLPAAPFLFAGFGAEVLKILKGVSIADARWSAFLLGAAAFLPVHFLAGKFFPGARRYLETLEHELTHLLIGLLFLKIPVGIRVSAHSGGEVRQIGFGTTGQIWITLAPYFFPTASLFVLLFSFAAGFEDFVLLALLGFTTAFHLISNWSETSFRQPDLQKAGILKTILILPLMNLLCYGAVLAFTGGGRTGFVRFWTQGFAQSVDFLKAFFGLIT